MIGFDEKKWILPALHHNNGIKYHINFPSVKIPRGFISTVVGSEDTHMLQMKFHFCISGMQFFS